MDSREAKGMQIAATMPLRRDAKGWIVPSQTGVGTYTVSPHPTTTYQVAQGLAEPPEGVQPWACDCPDFELRGQPCKHIIATTYVIRRESVYADGSTVTQEAKITYTQPWAAYNAGQCAEGDLFPAMLADLCSTIENRPQGLGRPRLPMADMAFNAIAKVYSGLSARRFDHDVREAKERGLTDVDPSFATVLRYLRDPALTPELERLVTLSAKPLAGVEDEFAIDSTGFTTCTYTRWYDEKWGKTQKRQDWIKLHAVTGVVTNIVTAANTTLTHGKDTSDHANFGPLLAKTAEHFQIRQFSADKAYSSRANLNAVEKFGGVPLIPFREHRVRGPQSPLFDLNALPPSPDADVWVRMYHLFAYERETFLANYHKRSNVETTFSVIKRKFGPAVRSKSEVGQFNETLAKVIAHNLCVLISCMSELGIDEPTFRPTPRLVAV